jgi:hypothetical protein
MRFAIAIATFAVFTPSASAEIMCTAHGGCWETGKQIRLLSNLRGVDQTLPSLTVSQISVSVPSRAAWATR